MTSLSPRSRIAAFAAALCVSLSLVAAPAVVAQDDDPTSAVQALVATLEAGDYAAVEGLFCEAFQGEAAGLSLSGLTDSLPAGVDPEVVIGAIRVQPTIETLETVSQSDLEATVRLVGTLALVVDVESLEPLIVALLEEGGQEVTDDMVEMIGGMMMTQFAAESIDVDEEITVSRADAESPWLLCDSLGTDDTDPEDSTDPEASVVPVDSADPEALDDDVDSIAEDESE